MMVAIASIFCLLSTTAFGQEPLHPVSTAKDGFRASDSYRYRSVFSPDKVLSPEQGFMSVNENLYYNLHWDDLLLVNVVRRAGAILELPYEPDDRVGGVVAKSPVGELTLDELLGSEESRVQGFVVVRDGKIVYEQYPGMNENDNHIWYSVSKVLPATLVYILEAQGKIDVSKSIETYVGATRGTHWEGIPVIDILDMASGLDLAETQETMLVSTHKVNKYFQLSLGGIVERTEPGGPGPQTADEVVYSIDAKDDVSSGTIFEYSSLNTKMLTLLSEQVSGKRFSELLSEYIWSEIGAEGDALMAINANGSAAAGGQMNSRLRDLARYGLVFTSRWAEENEGVMVGKWGLDSPISMVDRIHNCRPELHRRAIEAAAAGNEGFFGPPDPDVRCNSRQWDSVYSDGDIFKGGVGGQGLYVSPSRNIVIAFFSTTLGGWEQYARAIALELVPDP